MIFFGIDPGKQGAVVALRRDGRIEWRAVWRDGQELVCAISRVADHFKGMRRIAVEHVQSQPKFGARSSFVFGYHAGMIEAILLDRKLTFEFVRPAQWQRSLLRKIDGASPKERAAKCAARLWPGEGAHRWKQHVIDAALIAEWLRRRENGQ